MFFWEDPVFLQKNKKNIVILTILFVEKHFHLTFLLRHQTCLNMPNGRGTSERSMEKGAQGRFLHYLRPAVATKSAKVVAAVNDGNVG